MTSRIILNEASVESLPETLFERSAHEPGGSGGTGRGTVITFSHGGQDMVLKSYFRGGLPGRFIRDAYLYTGLERTRMWREFRLLMAMGELGLPVPVPLAARCQMLTPLSYRGDLIMQQIDGARNLAEIAATETIREETWHQIGEVLARFHNHRVFHRDLNASNILIADDGEVYLVDFDKCYFRERATGRSRGWTGRNLKRLQQSLHKLSTRVRHFKFDKPGWRALLRGYESSAGSYLTLLCMTGLL